MHWASQPPSGYHSTRLAQYNQQGLPSQPNNQHTPFSYGVVQQSAQPVLFAATAACGYVNSPTAAATVQYNIIFRVCPSNSKSYLGSRVQLKRAIDGTKELLLPNFFNFWLTKVSTDRLIVSTDRQSLYRYKAVGENTAKVSTTFVEQFWMSAKSKTINNVRYITVTVAGKPVTISEASIRSDLLFDDADGIDTLNNQAIFDTIQLMGPSPLIPIPDSNPEGSGGNHGGHSSNDRSLSRNEDGLTLQSVYDLCVSLRKQVIIQAKQIKDLKAQIKKLKKKARPVITHHKAWMKSVSMKTRLTGKKSTQKKWMQKESVSKQGRKTAKSKPTTHKDQAFDDLDYFDALDYMETEDAHNEKGVSTEDQVSTVKPDEGIDKPKVSTDKIDEGTAELKNGNSDENALRSDQAYSI
ncbi:hypothetical protein Tco_0497049 [Tanacetum coccineum]